MSDYVRMTIAVPKETYSRLRESAQRDMRQPRQQAHWLLHQALGLMSEDDQPQQNANLAGAVVEAVPSEIAS